MPDAAPGIADIDPTSWQVTILPLPKGHSRGSAYGFCGGHPVGRAERLRSPSVGCWWPDGRPELLTFPGCKLVNPGRAAGNVIPGHWRTDDGTMGALRWRLRSGALEGGRLDAPPLASSWATAATDGMVVGIGTPPRPADGRARNVGVVWREDGTVEVISGEGDVVINAGAGTAVAGNVRGRAMLWPDAASTPIDLTPPGMAMADIRALDGAVQAGVAYKGNRSRAALWAGTATSCRDLTPTAMQVAQLSDAASGYQVGSVRARENTPNGTPGSDNRAVLWQGAADRWIDLNALLPQDKYNASSAMAIAVEGGVVRICGQAVRYEVERAGTPHESHVVPVTHPVLWTARRRGG